MIIVVPIRIFIFLMALGSGSVHATKACASSPCIDNNGVFNSEVCRTSAEWILTGLVTEVDHNWQSQPMNKDLASFKVKVLRIEKQDPTNIRELNFTVGWCTNPEGPNQVSREPVTVYGVGSITAAEPRFLYFAGNAGTQAKRWADRFPLWFRNIWPN